MDATDKKAMMFTDELSFTATFPNLILLADSFWLRKITVYPHLLADVYVELSDDGYPELNICISAPILGSYVYTHT